MAENLSNDTNEVRDEMDHHHHHEKPFPGMMCPYLAGGGVPMGMYPAYSMGGLATGMYPFYPARDMGGMMHHHHDHHHEDLLGTIQDCEVTCEHMTHMIREKHDAHMRKKQLELLRDCADVCTLMAKILARHSEFSRPFADFCAVVCETCGNVCAKFPEEESQRCARVCLNCGKECSEFAMSMM